MNFAAMFQTWVSVLTHPGENVFQEERAKPQATLTNALIWIVVAAVIAAIFSAIGVLISHALGAGTGVLQSVLSGIDLPPEARQQILRFAAGRAGGGFFGTLCISFVLVPVGFFIGSGIYFVVAKLFGGEGTFEEQSYLLATFSAPIIIVNSVIGIIPFLGGCITFFISIYQLVLTYYAVKVSHKLTSGKALMTVLIPILVLFLCVICVFAIMFFAILGAASGMNY